MKLMACRHMWGVTEPWEVAVPRFASMGYEAIEMGLGGLGSASGQEGSALGRWVDLLNRHQLAYVPMAFTGDEGGGGSEVARHAESLRRQVRVAKAVGKALDRGIVHLTVHSGRDRFTLAEGVEFFREAERISKGEGVELAHETHRGRVLYNPWRTAEILAEVPGTRLCCDFSHWVVVAERLLPDCDEIIELAARHSIHLHTRVGYSQGPQVADPSAPEHAAALEAHEGWWRTVWRHQRAAGVARSSFTPEFGPPEYLHTLPHTNAPVADLQRVCEWMKARVERQFAEGGE